MARFASDLELPSTTAEPPDIQASFRLPAVLRSTLLPGQSRYLGTKMAARMTSSGKSTCSSLSAGFPEDVVCFALTALMLGLLRWDTSPPCAEHSYL